MAVQETNRVAPFGALTIHRVITRIEALVATVASWNNERKTVATLSRLSDHELNDIGLCRGDIHALARRR